MMDAATALLESAGQAAGQHPWLAMALLCLATLVSEDLACLTAGLLVGSGQLGLGPGVGACALGIWLGDLGLYGLGALARRGAGRWRWLDRVATPQRLAVGGAHFRKHGAAFLVASRFLPGTRLPGYLAAGILGYPLGKFALIMGLAALLWVPLLVGAAHGIGAGVMGPLRAARGWLWWGLPLLWLAARWGGKLAVALGSWRGRRLLWGRWLRLTRWEFWPAWAFYPPVVLWTVLLALRHRSATVFTLCNPGIQLGGLVMESKSAILTALQKHNPHAAAVAAWTSLTPGPPETRMAALETFMAAGGLDFPIVLKPDVGERGQGVLIVRSWGIAREYLSGCCGPVIAQRFVSGVEFGVFYCRQPGEQQGRVVSVAGKHPQSLTGDGLRALEDLILADGRAVAMAPYYLRKFAGRLAEVPAAGEIVAMAEIGTHCRGAVFTDERQLITPALTAAVEALTRPFAGFHFGRYDLRVPDAAALQAGLGLQVLELNGVTAEPAHIYQPGYPLWRAWRDLCRNWSEAFAAGAAHQAEGQKPPPFRTVLAVLRESRQYQRFEADGLLRGPAELSGEKTVGYSPA